MAGCGDTFCHPSYTGKHKKEGHCPDQPGHNLRTYLKNNQSKFRGKRERTREKERIIKRRNQIGHFSMSVHLCKLLYRVNRKSSILQVDYTSVQLLFKVS
jgi:hypothetical protein